MPEIDDFNSKANEAGQLDQLQSINESMQKLVSLESVQATNLSTNQFFQGNAVASTVGNLPSVQQVSALGYSRFESDITKLTQSVNSIAQRVGAPVVDTAGGATSYAMSQPFISELNRPFQQRAQSFWGVDPMYETSYRSTFMKDIGASVGLTRAPQNMYQSDFQAEASNNLRARVLGSGLSPLNLAGIDVARDEAMASDIESYSRRFIKFGASSAIAGSGLSRQESMSAAHGIYNLALNDLGINYEQARAVTGIAAETGQFIGSNNSAEMLSRVADILRETQNVAKATGMTIQEAAQTMGQLRQSMGVTSIGAQSQFLQSTAALGLASGLNTTELLGGALIGSNLARGTGYNVAMGGILGRNNLASTNNLYTSGILNENIIQQAGGVENLAAGLTASTINYATNQGQMYLMAGMQGGQFNQGKFNQALQGGFGNVGMMASSNINSIQSYANFQANKQDILAQAGTTNTLAMQRASLEQVFKSVNSRDFNQGSQEDVNMMKMLASETMFGGDSNTANAFVQSNFTEDGQRSMANTRRAAAGAMKMSQRKRALDLDYQENSFGGFVTRMENTLYNNPRAAIQERISDWAYGSSPEDIIANRAKERALGQGGYGSISSGDEQRFLLNGDYKNSFNSDPALQLSTPNHTGAMTAAGTWVGAGAGFSGYTSGVMLASIGSGALTGAIEGIEGGPVGMAVGALAGAGWGALRGFWAGSISGGLAAVGTGAAIGGSYGLIKSLSTNNEQSILGKNMGQAYDNAVTSWNIGKNFSKAESATMQDPAFKKKMFSAMSSAGVLGQYSVTADNTIKIAAAVKQISQNTGYSTDMVSNFMQNEGMMKGNLLEGADLAVYNTYVKGNPDEGTAVAKQLTSFFDQGSWNPFHRSVDKGLDQLTDNTDALSALSDVLDAGSSGDAGARQTSVGNFLELTKGMGLDSEITDAIKDFGKTGKLPSGNIGGLKAAVDHLRQSSTGKKFNQDLAEKFSGMAEDYRGDSSTYKKLYALGSDGGSFNGKIGMLMGDLKEQSFRDAVRADPTLKRVVSTFESNISSADFSSTKAFGDKFGVNVDDSQLQALKKTFTTEGADALKKDLIANEIGGAHAGPAGASEAKSLADFGHSAVELANVVKEMKNK